MYIHMKYRLVHTFQHLTQADNSHSKLLQKYNSIQICRGNTVQNTVTLIMTLVNGQEYNQVDLNNCILCPSWSSLAKLKKNYEAYEIVLGI